MPFDRFLIAPFNEGLRTDLRPWLIPDDAFEELYNAYVWRGRVRKRFGGQLMGVGSTGPVTAPLLSRLRTTLSDPLTLGGGAGVGITTAITGNATNPALPVPWSTYSIGQYFLINGWHYYVTALGVPANLTPEVGAPVTTATFNTTTGVYIFTGVSPSSQIYFYPNGDYITPAPGSPISGVVPGTKFNKGQQISVGDNIFTIISNVAGPQAMLSTNATASGTFDITDGAFTLTIPLQPAGVHIYYYPGLPVMGLGNYELGPVNDQPSFGFDTQFAYNFTNGWDRSGAVIPVVFTGDDTQPFWITNFTAATSDQVAMFVSNYNFVPGVFAPSPGDPMWAYSVQLAPEWQQFQPQYNDANDFVFTAKIILPYKGRLLLLNVVEQDAGKTTNTAVINRCRYSAVGVPLDADAFIEPDNVRSEGGGFLDAATDEAIITAEFIKDRLIVYFERSTWELAFTNSPAQPFIWQKINTELGAESTFSAVPFDKAILAIGNTGVHACTGANVERIDTKIPDQIFQIANKDEGVQRVVGIRDYYVEMVYWTFPNSAESSVLKYPNQVLVYNYKTNSWAFNDDCITMFGYYEQQLATTWAELWMPWSDNNSTWDSGVQQSNFRQVIAGNQQGYVFIVAPDTPSNAPVMSITNIVPTGANNILTLTVIDHTLQTQVDNNGDYIYITNCQGVTGINDAIYPVNAVIDANTIQIALPGNVTYAGTYSGGGSITRVSMIDILTKQFNPYIDKGQDVYIAKIDFGVLATAFGQLKIDYSPSATPLSMVGDGTANGSILGTSILETFAYPNVPIEYTSNRLWHQVYFQVDGECIQFEMYLSPTQITTPNIAFSDFWLEGMVLHCMPVRSRLS